MARQTLRRKQHHVDPYIVLRPGEARAQYFRRRRDPAQAMMIDRKVKVVGPVAPFHLDEGEGAAAPGDQIDLASGHAQPFAQNPPAVKAQPPGGVTLGPAAPCFGGGTVQARSFSASARA